MNSKRVGIVFTLWATQLPLPLINMVNILRCLMPAFPGATAGNPLDDSSYGVPSLLLDMSPTLTFPDPLPGLDTVCFPSL